MERLLRLLGPVGGTVPNLEADVLADDGADVGAPNVFSNALGALGGALPDICCCGTNPKRRWIYTFNLSQLRNTSLLLPFLFPFSIHRAMMA